MSVRSSSTLSTGFRLVGSCAFFLSITLPSVAKAAGPPPKPVGKPAVSAPSPGDKRGEKDTVRPLGGQLVQLGDADDTPTPPIDRPFMSRADEDAPQNKLGGAGASIQSSGGTSFSSATPGTLQAAPSPQAQAVLGPAPYDLGRVKALRVGTSDINEPPMRVGNMDVLSPLVEELPMLGVSVTKADRSVVPDIPGAISQNQFFQVNRPGQSPVVLQIGKASAWVDKSEQPLRAAPLTIGNQIYLPVFSLASLIGAAPRLDPQGTLILNPTVQSTELFSVKGTVAATIKTSSPVPEGSYNVVTVKGASPKIYIDFTGYSMGFDAGNTTAERLVANGVNQVKGVRAAQPKFFPDVTRVVLDLKKPMVATLQRLPDPLLLALVLTEPEETAPVLTQDPTTPIPKIAEVTPGGQLTSSVLPAGGSLRGWKIVVDPGHGAHDTGARGAHSLEKNHALDIATRLMKELRARGATVLMTRTTDVFIPLPGRSDFANTRNADLFISVHINASVNKGSRGTETFFYTGQSRPLANMIHREFSKATGCPNRGVAQARFWVIRKTTMPSVLLECAFISNPTEEKMLMNPAWREKVAQSIARGVNNYANAFPAHGASG